MYKNVEILQIVEKVYPIASKDNLFGVCNFESIKNNLLDVRSKSRILQGAKSVIMLLFPYFTGYNLNQNVSAYAAIKDYHIVCADILNNICIHLYNEYKNNEFIPLVDSSPIPEVLSAARCGLGIIGKNNLLIHPVYGSFVFIGSIVTTLEIEDTQTDIKSCKDCLICKKNCPSGALGNEFKKERCISFISQKKGILSDEEINLLKKGDSVWGCDICQKNCPYNKDLPLTPIKEFLDSAKPIVKKEDATNSERAYSFRPPEVLIRSIEIMEDRNKA
jgi:epoxyqueuosine reductase